MFERYDTPVRCEQGHCFTTIWVPFASVKAARLDGRRFQHCPVGHHWSTVVPLDVATSDPSDLRQATTRHDLRIP